MKEKRWINRWICDPEFQGLRPLETLHGHLDKDFVEEPHREELKNVHTLFRKKITIKHDVKQVWLDISADDYYKLYINGQFITQGPAQSYAFCYYYNHIDITDYMKEGENIIGVHVYYQGMINRAYNSGEYRQGMIAEIWADGKLIMDDQWKCMRAQEYGYTHTFGYLTQFNEVIDNNKKILGWRQAGFDDSGWQDAVVKAEDDHELILQNTKNVVTEERYPVSVKAMPDGYLLDFGQQMVGTFYMKAVGCKGDKIKILFGEELTENGEVRSELRCNCLYEDALILAEGMNELEQYEYKCFRYVQLKTETKTEMSDFRVDYRHYPLNEDYCKCVSDDELIRGIWEISKNAIKNCAQEIFQDCPHREKAQYLGDLTIEAHSFCYLSGDTELFRKALYDFVHSTRVCKGMMAVAPGSFMQEIADFSMCFPYQVILYYDMTKDMAFLKEMIPVVEDLVHYFDQFQNETGLIENVKTKHNIVDWPWNMRDDYDFDVSDVIPGDGCHNVINAMYIGSKICLEKMKDIAGITYESQIDILKQSFINAFYCKETGLFVDSTVSSHSSLHANAYPLFYHLEPEDNQIVEFVRRKGLSCGLFIAYFVLYGLLRTGNKELAYELIVNRSEHSWYNMLREGATTAYEAWGKDQKWNTSLCHGWGSLPIPVLMDIWNEDWKWIFDK